MSAEKWIKDQWGSLSPNKKRYVIVGGIAVTFMILFKAVNSVMPQPAQNNDKQAQIRNILTDVDPRSVGIDSLADQVRHVIQNTDQLMKRMSNLEQGQQKFNEENSKRFVQFAREQNTLYNQKIGQFNDSVERAKQTLDIDSATHQLLPPDGDQKKDKKVDDGHKPTAINTDLESLFNRPSFYDYQRPAVGSLAGSNDHKPGEANYEALKIRLIKANVVVDKSYQGNAKNDNSANIFIPAGSILTGKLLNGIDAPTNKGARLDPYPVLVRIKDEAILPNLYNADVRECFAIAAGYGELSSERAYLRAETFSCVRDDGGVIEVPIDAYAIGEDGKVGMRGRVVNKQGALLANALMAGLLRGFSDAFGKSQTQVLALTGANGVSTTPVQRAFSVDALEGGALKGTGYAMDRLANYYIDLAEDIFPVIEIDATRKVELVLQHGLSLKLYGDQKPVAESTEKKNAATG